MTARGCLEVNLRLRASNADVVAFHVRLVYKVEERLSMGRWLY